MENKSVSIIKDYLIAVGFCIVAYYFVFVPIYFILDVILFGNLNLNVPASLGFLLTFKDIAPYFICYIIVGMLIPFVYQNSPRKWSLIVSLMLVIKLFLSTRILFVTPEFHLIHYLHITTLFLAIPVTYFSTLISLKYIQPKFSPRIVPAKA